MSNYYEIKIGNRTIKNLYQGASFIERIDEEFDEFRTIQFASKSNQPYPMGAKAEVKINDKTYYFVVAKDIVELFAREPLCYSHTLELKEETEFLNHRVAESLGFHRMGAKNISILEAIERYRRIVPLERRDLHEETRLFNISESLKEKLKETLPEIVLSEGLVFDQLSQFSQLVDAVPYIENRELDFVEFNKRGKLITNDRNIVDIRSYHDLTNYITDVVTFISNGTVNHDNYTDTPEAFISPRSEDVVLSDNASQIVLQYPIKDIIKVELVCKISTKYTFNSEEINKFFSDVENYASKQTTVIRRGSEYGAIDITGFVVPIQKYRTLPSEVSNTRLTKANCLYFSYGSNTIEGTGDTYQRFVAFFNIETIVTENLIGSLPTWKGEESISPAANGPRNYIFRVTYHPLMRSRVKMLRSNESVPSELLVSQSASTVDLEKQGKLLQNLIKRLGHADKTLFRIFNSYDNVNHVGDYLSDGYIITAVEHVIYRDYVFSIEQYNKHYNRRSMYVGLNQEPRPFLVGDTVVNRSLNYMEKVVISDAVILGTSSLMTDSGKDKFEEMFSKDRMTYSTSVLDGVILSSYDMDNKKEGGSEEIFLPLVVNEFGNTILLSFELASQTSAGDCVEEKENKSYQTLASVQYTNSKGGVYYLNVNFGSAHITIPIEAVDELPYNNNNITIRGRTWPRGVAYDESQVTQDKPGGNTSINDYKEGYGMYYWFDNQYTNYTSKTYYVKSTKKYYRSYLQQIMKLAQQPYYEGGYNGELFDAWAYYEMFEEVDPALVGSTIQSQLQGAQDFPKGNKRNLDSLISTNEDTRFVVDKNVSEKISMTYQLCVESNSENIIVGDYFIKNNHFITHNSEPLMLWISKEKYEVNDTKVAKGNKAVNDNENVCEIILNTDHSLEMNYEFKEDEKSWAIATEDGKLILACNLPIKKVYFNYLNK